MSVSARLGEGDCGAIMRHFIVVERAGDFALNGRIVRPLAESLRKRLCEDPTWPPWIPLRESDGARPATESADPVAGERDE